MLRYLLWAAIGSGAGYYVAKKHLEADYDVRLRDEVEATREFYKNMYDERLKKELAKTREQADILKEAEVEATLSEVINEKYKPARKVDIPEHPKEESEEIMPEEAAAALVNYQGMSAASAEPVGNLSRVFEKATVPEEELTYVKPDGPRLIDFEMYDANGGDYEQETVVFYSKDSIVANERDEKLSEEFVGRHISYGNLSKLNEDNTTIYIRDDNHRKDFEVVWSRGSYDAEVLGKTG